MKRLYIYFLIAFCLTFYCASLPAKTSVTATTRFKIEKLSTPTIKIGQKTLKQGDVFNASETIYWNTADQSMLVKNVSTSELIRFSKRVSEKKGKISSILDLYTHINVGSTRGIFNHISLEKSAKSNIFPERRIALVVGNQNYEYLAPLKNAQKDAEDVAITLKNLGFDLIELYETTYSELMAGINKFAGLAKNYDVALVYYAGHGIQEDHTNYLVPIDNMLDREADLRDCVSCNEIVQKVENSGCPSKIFYFDACRDRKTSWSRSVLNGLSAMEGDAGTVIVFATQSGKVAADGERDDNSPFAKMLIKNMQVPKLSFPEMMSALVKDTYNITGKRQYPVKVGELISDFIFNPVSAQVENNHDKEEESPYNTRIFKQAIAYDKEGQYEKAMNTYMKEPDNPWCQTNIGSYYLSGKGGEIDYNKAREWFMKADAQGDDHAMQGMGWSYFDEEKYPEAMEWLLKADRNGNISSSYLIGYMYQFGLGVPQDNNQAIEWYQKGIGKGDPSSMIGLADIYYHGYGVPMNEQKAQELFLKAAARDYPYAMFMAGRSYSEGYMIPRDYAKSFEWFRKAAEAGYGDAYYKVGNAYFNGTGVNQDYEKAYEWAKKGADIGKIDCIYLMGLLYHEGSPNLPRNYAKAAELYQKAADKGHGYAMLNLANLYYTGSGVPKNEATALELYNKAASHGVDPAMTYLGTFYKNGTCGVKKDAGKAKEWYEKAAARGNLEAMCGLGNLYDEKNDYHDGKGLVEYPHKAFEWYEKAALANHNDAMRILGWKYYYGHGVKADKAKAKEWLQKSADGGNELAIKYLREMFK